MQKDYSKPGHAKKGTPNPAMLKKYSESGHAKSTVNPAMQKDYAMLKRCHAKKAHRCKRVISVHPGCGVRRNRRMCAGYSTPHVSLFPFAGGVVGTVHGTPGWRLP